MSAGLPLSLMALFAPRPPPPYAPPIDLPKNGEYSGIAALVAKFEEKNEVPVKEEEPKVDKKLRER